MTQIDVEPLLAPIDPDSPSGPDMAYDADYLELERIAAGTPAQQMGDSVIAGEDPDWADVERRAAAMLEQTKDLRVILMYTVACMERHGVDGLASGLTVLRHAIESYWDTIHPQLDPDDDLDPTERVNIIASIAAPPGLSGDTVRFLSRIRALPLTESRAFGRFGLRSLALASGEANPVGEETVPDSSSIGAAFEDTDLELLTERANRAAIASEESRKIDASLTELVGPGQAPDLTDFLKTVRELDALLAEHVSRRAPVEIEVKTEPGEDGQPVAAAVAAQVPGEINSREDIVRQLDRICDYYKRHEPSSPVPILLRRAQSIVSKDFVDILRELTEVELDEFRIRFGDGPRADEGEFEE